MKTPALFLLALILLATWAFPIGPAPEIWAQSSQVIKLKPPRTTGGLPLNEALKKRRSLRNFLDKELDLNQLSQLLWSAFGVNREASKMRVIPTSHNRQDLQIFVVLKSGIWQYDAEKDLLNQYVSGNFQAEFGGAPVTLIYVVPTKDGIIGGLHVGLAAQNVGLYCASEGLGNVIKTTGVDLLKGKLPLASGYQIVVIHQVGYPSANY